MLTATEARTESQRLGFLKPIEAFLRVIDQEMDTAVRNAIQAGQRSVELEFRLNTQELLLNDHDGVIRLLSALREVLSTTGYTYGLESVPAKRGKPSNTFIITLGW